MIGLHMYVFLMINFSLSTKYITYFLKLQLYTGYKNLNCFLILTACIIRYAHYSFSALSANIKTQP